MRNRKSRARAIAIARTENTRFVLATKILLATLAACAALAVLAH
jgi:hypothetical protein